jgi:hypothetical protein
MTAPVDRQVLRGKKRNDAPTVAAAAAARLGVVIAGPNYTHYVNTSETDTGLLVEVWKKEE